MRRGLKGNSLFLVVVGQEGGEDYVKRVADPNRVATSVEVAEVSSEITDLQFQRTGDGEGRLTCS